MEEKEVTLPERLIELRNKRGKTQQEVADFLEMTRTGYSYYEKGRTKPDYSTIQKIAEYYNVPTNYILGEDEKTPQHDAGALAILNAIDLSDEAALQLLKSNLTFEGKEIDDENLKEILQYARYRLRLPKLLEDDETVLKRAKNLKDEHSRADSEGPTNKEDR